MMRTTRVGDRDFCADCGRAAACAGCTYAAYSEKAINEAIAVFNGFRAGCSICDDEGHELDWRDIDRRCREAVAMLRAALAKNPDALTPAQESSLRREELEMGKEERESVERVTAHAMAVTREADLRSVRTAPRVGPASIAPGVIEGCQVCGDLRCCCLDSPSEADIDPATHPSYRGTTTLSQSKASDDHITKIAALGAIDAVHHELSRALSLNERAAELLRESLATHVAFGDANGR